MQDGALYRRHVTWRLATDRGPADTPIGWFCILQWKDVPASREDSIRKKKAVSLILFFSFFRLISLFFSRIIASEIVYLILTDHSDWVNKPNKKHVHAWHESNFDARKYFSLHSG